MPRASPRTSVLICGGGPVGLALAVELGWRGVECLLVEQGDGGVTSPKANHVNVRTMEHCRRWGVADAVKAIPFPDDYPNDVSFVTALTGFELARLPRPARRDRASTPSSPEIGQTCSQHWFDPILRDLARSFATVRLRHRCRLDSFEERDGEIVARFRDLANDRIEEVSALYLAGCDGGASLVRQRLGIALNGTPILGRPLNALMEAPGLIALSGKAPALRYMVVGPSGVWANFRCIDPDNDLWRISLTDLPPEEVADDAGLDRALERAVGGAIGHRWVSRFPWTRRSVVAERYRSGNVFLVGDAAHQLSPTGAYGMNTGVGDAVDLGWKIAAKLAGWGGEGLLAAYDAERRPVGERNVRAAEENYRHWVAPPEFGDLNEDSPEGDARRAAVGAQLIESLKMEFSGDGVPLGYRYDESPICVADGTPPPEEDFARYAPTTRPGARAPHAWLPDGRSTLDLFGRGYVLLCVGAEPADAGPLADAAARAAMPFQAVRLDAPDIAALYERRFVLVRPDGHVAWRGDAIPQDCRAVVDRVRGAEAPSAGRRAI